ncbi:MAG: sulfatase-like hydrolase/transferase [Verrucomicrobiota bacterium]
MQLIRYALLLFSTLSSAALQADKPNILYIFTDDQSIRTVSCYAEAQPWAHTPNLDALAEQGLRFRYSYTGAKCVPSRGNALTGMLQFNYDRQTPYWAKHFRSQGYYTGMIGKWHWGETRYKETWDWSAVWEHHLPKKDGVNDYYWGQSLRINGEELVPLDQYSTDAYTDRTIDFLKERAAKPDQPWYFWLCYGAVHGPYTPADRHVGSLAEAPEMAYPKDIWPPRPDKPEHMVNLSANPPHPETGKPIKGDKYLDEIVKMYHEAVKAVDEGLGRIMKALEENGQLENTLVVFTSDQGYAWGHHGFNLKIAPYDANLLAPLIISWPGNVPANTRSAIPVNGVDLVRTFHSVAGIKPSEKLDGRDLTELIREPATSKWDDQAMLQTYTGNIYGQKQMVAELEKAHQSGDWSEFITHKTGIRAWLMIRQGKYKYVRYIYEDYLDELYDIEADPEELHNLAVRQEYHEVKLEMRGLLSDELDKNGAKFIPLLPEPLQIY